MIKILLASVVVFSLNAPFASAANPGWMDCRSKFVRCEYQCPVKPRYKEACVAVGGADCRATGPITYVISAGVPNGYIVAFDIDANFPELLCRNSHPVKMRSRVNPVVREYYELFGK